MADGTSLLLSIRPQHADQIFSGEKTVELRRVRPRLNSGDIVLVYVTAPVMTLAGAFKVSEVTAKSSNALWREVGPKTGLSFSEFKTYFRGTDAAYGIGIERSWHLAAPVPLNELRRRVPGFVPPRSYWYVPRDLLATLLGNDETGKKALRGASRCLKGTRCQFTCV